MNAAGAALRAELELELLAAPLGVGDTAKIIGPVDEQEDNVNAPAVKFTNRPAMVLKFVYVSTLEVLVTIDRKRQVIENIPVKHLQWTKKARLAGLGKGSCTNRLLRFQR